MYPGSKIILASGNKKQSSSIITEKIADLRRNHPMLDREIEDIKTNHDDVKCVFKNGSTIVVVAANDGATITARIGSILLRLFGSSTA